jgi:hypothetical protein
MDFFAQLFRDCGWWYAIMLVGSSAVGLIILVVSLIRHLNAREVPQFQPARTS